jgi:hypothetical protein
VVERADTGDFGHLDTFAELLADEFTVVTYDRRGKRAHSAAAGAGYN